MKLAYFCFLFVFIQTVHLLEFAEDSPDDATNLDTLELVQVVFRHGDRTPTRSYPLDPYRNMSRFWPQGLGQLTDIGKRMHYNLGRYFRKRYDGFLNQTYVPHEIFVLSSDMDRTTMSAESNLAGLYQPKDSQDNWNPVLPWTPIPIRTVPRTEDKFLRTTKECLRYQRVHSKLMQSDAVRKFNEEHNGFIEYVTNNTGIHGDSMEDIAGVEDVLTVQKFHHFQLPSWASKILNRFHELAVKTFLFNTYTKEMKRLKGGPLLKMMIDNIKEHVNQNSNQVEDMDPDLEIDFVGKAKKLYMFSAHDSTLMRIMDTLGVFYPINPPYASAFMVELHRDKNSEDMLVKVFFRNETNRAPYELEIPGCGPHCHLNVFVNLMEPVTPNDWEAECGGYHSIKSTTTERPELKLNFDSSAHSSAHASPDIQVLAEACLIVGVLFILIVIILFIARDRFSYPIVTHTYPFLKSRKNNYGSSYESV